MNSLNLNQNDATGHAIDYWQVLKNRYGIILLTFLLVFMTAAVITYVMPKKYESVAQVEVRPAQQTVSILGRDKSEVSNRAFTANFMRTQFEVIKAQKTLERVADNLDLTTRWEMDRQTTIQTLKSIVSVDNTRGTDIIEIKVRHLNAFDAQEVAAEVATAYQARRNDEERSFADRSLQAIDDELRKQSDDVVEKKQQMDAIAVSRGIIYERQGSGAAVQTKIAERSEFNLHDLSRDADELEAQINSLLELKNTQLMEYAAGLDLPENIVKRLYPEYLESKRRLVQLSAVGLGPQHPRVLGHQETLSEMWKDLNQGVEGLRATLGIRLEQVKQRQQNAEILTQKTRDNAVEDSLGQHEFDDARNEYNMAVDTLQQMRLKYMAEKAGLSIPRDAITIHATPQVAKSYVSPNVTLNLLLGGIVGLIFGVGIAFFLELLDTSVKSLEDVERYLQVPVLAVIPKDVGVLHKQSGMSPDAEAYRILRTNIEFNRKNPEDNSITVVSGGAGEGKSTTLVNLAYICAQGGYTTLMIDGDLRRPRLHTFFDINNSVGLTNYLTTELMLEDVILQTPVDNLFFMPSGILPADAAGILNSRRMSELIQDVKQRFDLVLVDSPPILGVSDASVLASEVDLTMIVVQHRKLPRNMLQRVKQAVENVGGHVIGVVLNNVDVRSDSQYQYYTSYYTYYAPTGADPVEMAPQTRIEPEVASTSASHKSDDLY